MDIDGNALVIGAGSGIGRDASIAYVLEGVQNITLADINLDSAEETLDQCNLVVASRGRPIRSIVSRHVDVSDEASVNQLVEDAVASMGSIDYCVVTAGVGVREPREVSEASVLELERFWDVNVKGTFLCLKAVSAAMKKQDIKTVQSRSLRGEEAAKNRREIGRGTIIVLGSCNSYVATPHIVQYTAAKHALLGMVKNAALDNAPHRIRVNAVCPSWVDTPMTDEAVKGDPNLQKVMQRVVPLERIALQEEISDVIMFLSSYRASYITGSGLLVDGGTTLQLQT